MSPTVGLYINPKDYIRFLSDIRGYLNTPLEFINPEESKYFADLKRKNQLHVPIGKIKDVEIIFLHYKTENEAYEKWTRRAARVNYNNLIVKFSQMNNCGLKELAAFDRLDFKKRLMFVNKAKIADKFRTAIYFRGQEELEELNSDTTFFNTYVNLYTLVKITMVEDEEGFEYPQIDREKCVRCYMCLKVCPFKWEVKKTAYC